jgi:endonuclease/exonuclease/phosphatase (EEP) superfamily protein YafD
MVIKLFSRLVLGLGVFLTILTVASFLNPLYWLFDVLTHFNVQYATGLTACIAMALALRSRWQYGSIFLVALLANCYLLFPFFWPLKPVSSTPSLRVVTLNVFTDNHDYQKIIEYLRTSDSDVVFISEIEPELMVALREDLLELYPYIYDESMEGTHGLAFVSKHPLQSESIALDQRYHRFIRATLEWQGREVSIYGAHPHPPLAGSWAKSRNNEIAVIRDQLQQEFKPHIFLGDFNASPWSYPMQQLFKQTTLKHGAKGFGLYPTWRYKTLLLGAPLDHILVSPEWKVIAYRLESDIGSDHFPVVADIFLN